MNVLLDTSIWIPYLRTGKHAQIVDPLIARGRIVLHSTVLLELYAGAASLGDKRDIDSLFTEARRLDRMVHAAVEDLALAGQVLSSYAPRRGRVRPRDHAHDLLIAIGAGRSRSLLLTENVSDMRRWQLELARRGKLAVRVAAP